MSQLNGRVTVTSPTRDGLPLPTTLQTVQDGTAMNGARTSSSSSFIYDVIVVGGGISGLVAARQLSKAGWTVLVLEARDRLGGRVYTQELGEGKGHKIDLGASYVHGVYGNPVAEAAREIGMELKLYEEEHGVLRDHEGRIPPDDLKIFQNTSECMFSYLKQLSQASPDSPAPAADIPLIEPFLSPSSPLYRGLTTNESKKQAITVARSYAGWCGADLSRVSFKYWGFEQDTQGPDGLVASGYGTLVDWLGREIRDAGGEIRLGEEVTAVEYLRDEGDYVIVRSTTNNAPQVSESTYRGLYTLITLPLGVLQSRPPKFTPPLPPRRLAATHRLGHGLLNKVFVYYDTAWWSDNSTIWLLPDPSNPGNLLGREDAPAAVHVHNLWTLQGTPAFCFFMTGPAAERVEQLTDAEVQHWAERIIGQYLSPSSPPPKPKKVLTTRWRSDPYAFGSYVYIPVTQPGGTEASPLDMMEMSHPLWGRWFFAGEHTEPDEYASVHAAWRSGVREAGRLDVALRARKGSV